MSQSSQNIVTEPLVLAAEVYQGETFDMYLASPYSNDSGNHFDNTVVDKEPFNYDIHSFSHTFPSIYPDVVPDASTTCDDFNASAFYPYAPEYTDLWSNTPTCNVRTDPHDDVYSSPVTTVCPADLMMTSNPTPSNVHPPSWPELDTDSGFSSGMSSSNATPTTSPYRCIAPLPRGSFPMRSVPPLQAAQTDTFTYLDSSYSNDDGSEYIERPEVTSSTHKRKAPMSPPKTGPVKRARRVATDEVITIPPMPFAPRPVPFSVVQAVGSSLPPLNFSSGLPSSSGLPIPFIFPSSSTSPTTSPSPFSSSDAHFPKATISPMPFTPPPVPFSAVQAYTYGPSLHPLAFLSGFPSPSSLPFPFTFPSSSIFPSTSPLPFSSSVSSPFSSDSHSSSLTASSPTQVSGSRAKTRKEKDTEPGSKAVKGYFPCGLDGCTHVCTLSSDVPRHHESLKHKPKSYVCQICKAAYTRKDALVRHHRRKHECDD